MAGVGAGLCGGVYGYAVAVEGDEWWAGGERLMCERGWRISRVVMRSSYIHSLSI